MMEKTIQGVKVPSPGFGTWTLRGAEGARAVVDALEIGYRHIDTAAMYGNEEAVGRGIRESGIEREDLFLVTKVSPQDLHAADVRSSAENSLRKLNAGYVDLLLVHWPNENIDLEETLEAFFRLRDDGKIKLAGVSNFNRSLTKKAVSIGNIFCNQVEYHPFLNQDDLLKICRDHNLMLTAYSPIAKGRVMENRQLLEIGKTYGKTPAQVSIRWLMQQDNVVPIPRSSNHEHRKSNFNVFDFELSPSEMETIHQLTGNYRLIDEAFAPDWDK